MKLFYGKGSDISQKKQRGQGIVEVALVLPVFCLLLFGCIEWGIYFFAKLTLDSAAFSACRKASTFTDWPSNQSDREQEVIAEFNGIAKFIPTTAVNYTGKIQVVPDPDYNNIQYITVRFDQGQALTYNSITGFGGVYNLPKTIYTEARVCYEGY
ncbi:MAG TPA: hypothetical protein DF296_07025 [Candidatus Margulisbacteria bacterium]|nr:hypothetical protein [Candidatus Margulisiibacteriota bacterium]